MRLQVHIDAGPLSAVPPRWECPDAGAVLWFEGRVRPVEGGCRLEALEYEAYRPLADMELERLAETVADRFHLIGLAVEHSVGRVPAGACSFRLRLGALHRREALAALEQFVERMKREVPIWKTVVWEAGGPASRPAGKGG